MCAIFCKHLKNDNNKPLLFLIVAFIPDERDMQLINPAAALAYEISGSELCMYTSG